MPNVNVMFSFTICKVMLYYSYCLMSMLMRSSPSQPPNKYMPTGQSFQRFRGVLQAGRQLDSAPMQSTARGHSIWYLIALEAREGQMMGSLGRCGNVAILDFAIFPHLPVDEDGFGKLWKNPTSNPNQT